MKPISVGDLVVVLRGNGCRSCSPGNAGKIFRVEEIALTKTFFWKCGGCGVRLRGKSPTDPVVFGGGSAWDMPRLKRIPPLSELEGEKRDEDLKEPA